MTAATLITRTLAATAMAVVAASWTIPAAQAHDITSPADATKTAAFDISRVSAGTDGRLATFNMEVTGGAGTVTPTPVGQLKGARVDAYVWPTKMDPSAVGFAEKSGILALAVTAHPDFDDTPLFDENNDGDPANDGKNWHSHWVVLGEETRCGGGLKVQDIQPGKDLLPATAPGLPIALDSPGMSPQLAGKQVTLTVPLAGAEGVHFDGVTAQLEVNQTGGVPLLCVAAVRDVASGDLSMPGIIMKTPASAK